LCIKAHEWMPCQIIRVAHVTLNDPE
jgi:hypothetical protein